MSDPSEFADLFRVLNRETPIEQLGSVRRALSEPGSSRSPGSAIAFGLDANVLLNLGKGRMDADVVDYLGQRHSGPIILPFQAVLEFWNSRVTGIFGLGDKLRSQFEVLSETISTLDPAYDEFSEGAKKLVEDFHSRYGHVLEGKVATQVVALVDLLVDRALVPQIPLTLFAEVAHQRRRVKMPPGFKDDGDGDFYLWAEFLRGLQMARASGIAFDHSVLVTDDTKADWRTKGTVHPSLCAEVQAVVGTTFDTWSLQSLAGWVAESLGGTPS